MHILITDSGVGGLSVCAYAERFVRLHGFPEPVRLTFANASPENDYGYNSMKTRKEKVQTFDRFLTNVTERFAPDLIYVACNTLSVLLPDTRYFEHAQIPVRGIVTTGVELLLRELETSTDSVAIIFATQTTVDAGTYTRMLEQQGIDASRIISQACPGLADIISEDRQGAKTEAEIRSWVGTALAKLNRVDVPVVAALACTHYGYRKEQFASAFLGAGVRATIVNPNESAVDDIFSAQLPTRSEAMNRQVEVEFVTRYEIPPATLDALTWFLSDISPETITSMQRYKHLPDLF